MWYDTKGAKEATYAGQDKNAAEVFGGGAHESELVQRGNSRDENARYTASGGCNSLDDIVLVSAKWQARIGCPSFQQRKADDGLVELWLERGRFEQTLNPSITSSNIREPHLLREDWHSMSTLS